MVSCFSKKLFFLKAWAFLIIFLTLKNIAFSRSEILQSLIHYGLTENDLNFKKAVVIDTNLSPLVETLLNEPIKLFNFSENLEREFDQLPWQKTEPIPTPQLSITRPTEISTDLWQIIDPFISEVVTQKKRWEKNFSPISLSQKQKALATFALENFHLEKNLIQQKFWANQIKNKTLIPSLLQRGQNLELEDTELLQPQLDVAKFLNPIQFRSETQILLKVVSSFVETLKFTLKQHPNLADFNSYTFETPLGLVILSGKKSHHHTNEAVITIDLGGDDVYWDAGNASGILDKSFRLVVDLEGNDSYQGQTASGIFGVGLVWDEKGNDRYRSSDASLGCGLFGTGILIDPQGNDFYLSDTLSQGAAAFGYGFLLDQQGNDRYEVALQGQGFAGVNGLGVLADYAGNDYYQAGGKYPDYDRFRSRKLSLSQGFSIGYRPFAPGGLGVLYDKMGNDKYLCDVYGQGASYWYSCGALIDQQGDDRYESYQYSQGTGIHLSVGLLKDNSGDDRYLNHNGLAQGSAHDFAVGLLWDQAGSDSYESKDGAQGCAINNAVGMLCDESGNDHYKLLNKNQAIGQGYGGFSPQRGMGSLGFLFDVQGKNSFSQLDSSKSFFTQGQLGFAVLTSNFFMNPTSFTETNLFQLGDWQSDKPAGQIFDRETILQAGGDPELGILLMQASRYGNAPWKIHQRNQAKAKLRNLSPESYPKLIPWVMQSDIMIRVLIDELITKNPESWLPHLRTAIQTPYLPIQLLASYWLGEKGKPEDIELLMPLLKNSLSRPSALLALSKQKTVSEKITKQILPFLKSQRELERALAVKIIGRSQLKDCHKILFPFFEDSDWNVRIATWETFQSFSRTKREWAKLHQFQLSPLGQFWLNYHTGK